MRAAAGGLALLRAPERPADHPGATRILADPTLRRRWLERRRAKVDPLSRDAQRRRQAPRGAKRRPVGRRLAGARLYLDGQAGEGVEWQTRDDPADDELADDDGGAERPDVPPSRYADRCGMATLLTAHLGEGQDGEPHESHKARRLACGSWRCADCRRHLGAKWWCRLRGVRGIGYGLTLTIDPADYADAAAAEVALYACWDALRKRVGRWFSRMTGGRVRKLSYFSAVEWHKSGWPHVHVLLRNVPPIPYARDPIHASDVLESWFRRHGHDCGFGYVADCRPIWNHEGAASYVLSDLTKTYQLRHDYTRGFRRIRSSRDFFEDVPPSLPPDAVMAWAVVPEPLAAWLAGIERAGGTIRTVWYEDVYEGDARAGPDDAPLYDSLEEWQAARARPGEV